jgi:hypothetical protein
MRTVGRAGKEELRRLSTRFEKEAFVFDFRSGVERNVRM